MKKFSDYINEMKNDDMRQTLKQKYLNPSVKMEDIEKAFKNIKPGTMVKLMVNNPKSRSKQGLVSLLDIKKGDLLTTSLLTSPDKAGVFKIEDVISFDIYKI